MASYCSLRTRIGMGAVADGLVGSLELDGMPL
jgi:hypothetical protein